MIVICTEVAGNKIRFPCFVDCDVAYMLHAGMTSQSIANLSTNPWVILFFTPPDRGGHIPNNLTPRPQNSLDLPKGNSPELCMQGSSGVALREPEDSKPIRGRRKSRWKLKFHHQALPAEYLDHYTASLNAAAAAAATTPPVAPPAAAPPSTVRYNDLPYMGEMTLDNARPRRGRKPKKADICHLIYKNYGTTVVDEPLNLCVRDLKAKSASEVSMCKFKFTGGATPSLEEKKMLSVDPSGNFRYYGTGEPQRRKSRKSLAREKLEKTFREKGFLIQTQQLESAQGATYCKFRQLRKFTRYLFRSWKHHLPGDVVSEPMTETSLTR